MEQKYCQIKLFILLSLFQIITVGYCIEIQNVKIVKSTCSTIIGKINQTLINEVDHDTSHLYVFQIDSSEFNRDFWNTNMRIEVTSGTSLDYKCPLIFIIQQREEISTIEIPKNAIDKNFQYRRNSEYSAGQTLCIDHSLGRESRNVSVRVSTCSQVEVRFSLKLVVDKSFLLPLDKEVLIEVSPTNSKFYGFIFDRPDVTNVRVLATSDDDICATVSLQTFNCPVLDQDNNIAYEGYWQTMTRKAAMAIEKKRRFTDGFKLAIAVHRSEEKCGKTESKVNRKKIVKVMIKNETLLEDNVTLFHLALFIPVLVSLLVVCIVYTAFRVRHQWIRNTVREEFSHRDNEPPVSPLSEDFNMVPIIKNLNNNKQERVSEVERDSMLSSTSQPGDERYNKRVVSMVSTDTSFSTTKYPVHLTSVLRIQEQKWKCNANVYIGDFIQQDPRLALRNSRRFYWLVIICAIFYSVPTYNFLIHFIKIIFKTGEYDLCYYNYLCSHRLGFLFDFNHFWSNISYIIFGVAFVFLVRRRDVNLSLRGEESADCSCCFSFSCGEKCCCFPTVRGRWDHGIPPHFGVFFAMGYALIIEGFLSAAYHLCPNQSSFQFDTCFMYVIAVLCILKVYQFRHPIHLGANHTFGILAGFVFIAVLGLILEESNSTVIKIFRGIFIGLQFLFIIIVSIYYYSIGYIKDEEGTLITNWELFLKLRQLKNTPLAMDRLIFPCLSLLLSIGVVVYSELSPIGFGTYLLYTLIANVLGSVIYYVGIMKPLHKEFKNKFWIQPSLYFLASGVVGFLAMRYFISSPTAWEESASESRSNNQPCLNSWFPFFPFYDTHDVWHFYSAAALFLAFMGLLTTDDDLLTTHQSLIPVF